MAVTKEKKTVILKDLDEKFGKAKAVYFSDFRGLSVKDLGELRSKLREAGVDYRVAKKTLMRLSVKNNSFEEIPNELMEGPVGAAFGYEDLITPVKVLHDFGKDKGTLSILGGLVEGKYITKAEAVELAKLPSREELLARLVGSMKSPISGFYGVLSGVLRSFVYTVKAIEESKPAEEAKDDKPAEEAKDDKPAEEAKDDKPAEEAKDDKPAEEAKDDKPDEEAKDDKPDEEAKDDKPAEEAKDDKPAEEA